MNIQAVMNNVCGGVSKAATAGADSAVAVAQWLGRTVSVMGQTVVQYAKNAVAVALPYFASLKNFAMQNQGTITVAAAGVAVGAVGYALVSSLFSRPAQVQATASV